MLFPLLLPSPSLFFFLVRPLSPNAAIILQHEDAGKPRAPTSTEKYHVCHPSLLHSVIRSSYFARLHSWASWHRVSQGTVSSITTSFFLASDNRRISGLSVVSTIGGKTSFFPKSTRNSQSLAVQSIPSLLLVAFSFLASQLLTKLIIFGCSEYGWSFSALSLMCVPVSIKPGHVSICTSPD